MKMHLLSGGRLRMRKSIYMPDADKSETIELPVPCALLRHAQGNVLFDTGCHPSVADDPEARWGGLARLMTPIMAPGDNVVNALGGIGLSCDDIDVVVCSHLHPDHCGCNTFFKRATCHRSCARRSRRRAPPDALAQGYIAAEWEQGAADRYDRRRARRVRRRPHRAGAAARPYAGHDRRAGRGSTDRGDVLARRPTRCQSALDARYRRGAAATPGMRTRWSNRSPRSGASKRPARRSSAATTPRNGKRCARAPTPMSDAAEIHARPKLIGARIKRTEDPRLLTGRGAYTDDRQVPRVLHVAFRRSDQSHARIRRDRLRGGARGARRRRGAHRRRSRRSGQAAGRDLAHEELLRDADPAAGARQGALRRRAGRRRRRAEPLSGRGRAGADRDRIRAAARRGRSGTGGARRRAAAARRGRHQRAGEPRIQARRCRCRVAQGAGARRRPLPHAPQDAGRDRAARLRLPNTTPGARR